jgi:hypothetical protein
VTGATIDHLISVTILIAALFVAMMTYNGLFASAIDYDRNRQVANKAIDITNTICLSPGNPTNWGETNETLLGFGLQDPRVGGYALSPYSIMRLRTSNDSQLIEYNYTPGVFYNNLSASYGNSILTPVGDCINYSSATELLGINGKYGFSVDITPTLNVSISQVPGDHLTLKVDVRGSGLPLSDATLKYFLFHVDKGDGNYPKFMTYSGVVQSDSFGSALLDFSSVEDTDAYTFMVYASLSGLNGVGYYCQDDVTDEHEFLLPLIQDFDNGTIIIAHNWDVHYFGPPEPNVFYNATFFVLTSDFQLQQSSIVNSTNQINYGVGKPYYTTQLPTSEVGFLFISYRWNNQLGSVILPWGVGAIGVPASFSSGIGSSSGYDFVATELRQVTIDGISYQVKVSTWSLGD